MADKVVAAHVLERNGIYRYLYFPYLAYVVVCVPLLLEKCFIAKQQPHVSVELAREPWRKCMYPMTFKVVLFHKHHK